MGTSLSAAGKGTVSAKGQWLVWPRGCEGCEAASWERGGSPPRPPAQRSAAGQPEEPHGAGPGRPGGSTLQQCRQPFLLQLPAWRAAGSLFTAQGFRACPGVAASLALTQLTLSSSEGEDNPEAT